MDKNKERMEREKVITLLRLVKENGLKIDIAADEICSLFNVINWVAVSEKLPPRPDEDYLVCVRNKNKEGGIPIQDIGNFSSDGVWIKQNTWEDVVFWAELPKPPCLYLVS